MDPTFDRAKRRIIIAWLSLGVGLASFVFLSVSCSLGLSIQFSCCLSILTWLCFRWWTDPVHPGKYGYISPYTIIFVHSFFYFGAGNLPVLAFPELRFSPNYGARPYYLPMLLIVIAGLVIFDIVYRKMVSRLAVNRSLEESIKSYYSREIQNFIPVASIAWYLLCAGIFAYMSTTYLMRPFSFVGVEGNIDNIFMQSGHYLLGTSWSLLSLALFKPGKRSLKLVYAVMLLTLVPIIFGYQNRRIIVYIMIVSVGVYYLNKDKVPFRRISLIAGLLVLFSFILVSSIKIVRSPSLKRYMAEEKNLYHRAIYIINTPDFLRLDPLLRMLKKNVVTRICALDYVAAIMEAHENSGIPFMGGEHNLLAASKIVPRVLWLDKPTLGPEGVMTRYFELNYFDQLSSLLSSSYADGGMPGVILGFAFLGLFFPVVTKIIFLRKDGVIVYIGGLVLVLSFENFLMWYILLWLRWVLIIMAVNSILRFFYSPPLSRRPIIEG